MWPILPSYDTNLSFSTGPVARVFKADGEGRARRTDTSDGLEIAHLVLGAAVRITKVGAVVL